MEDLGGRGSLGLKEPAFSIEKWVWFRHVRYGQLSLYQEALYTVINMWRGPQIKTIRFPPEITYEMYQINSLHPPAMQVETLYET